VIFFDISKFFDYIAPLAPSVAHCGTAWITQVVLVEPEPTSKA